MNNEICARSPRMILLRRLCFLMRMSTMASNSWRRRWALWEYRRWRTKFLQLLSYGLI